jgi:hypothetical protein
LVEKKDHFGRLTPRVAPVLEALKKWDAEKRGFGGLHADISK